MVGVVISSVPMIFLKKRGERLLWEFEDQFLSVAIQDIQKVYLKLHSEGYEVVVEGRSSIIWTSPAMTNIDYARQLWKQFKAALQCDTQNADFDLSGNLVSVAAPVSGYISSMSSFSTLSRQT